MTTAGDLVAWYQALRTSYDEKAATDAAFQHLENAGLINKVRVHQYLCEQGGCVLATVIRIGDRTLARTRDYKLAPAANLNQSVESARRTRTLDGDRHWPGLTFDVTDLATPGGDVELIPINCRHRLRTIDPREIIAVTLEAKPGHPGKPTRL